MMRNYIPPIQPMPAPVMPPPAPPKIPPLADSPAGEQLDAFLPTYSMMAYMPAQQVLTRSLGLFDD